MLIAAERVEGNELPSVQDARDQFEAALVADDSAAGAGLDPEQAELRRALGLS